MRSTRISTALCLLSATAVLAACGGDDENATPGPAPQGTAEAQATPTPKEQGPVKTPIYEELPSETPEPGPPAKFRVVVTDDAITPSVKRLPEGPSLQATVINRTDELTPFNFFVTKRAVIGAGQIKADEQVAVQMRNVLPGELFVTAPPGRRATIEITPK